MSEQLPQWALDLLPDDEALLTGLQQMCRAWLANGLALHPQQDGGLTYYPKALSATQKALVEQMRPYKPLLEAILKAHPAIDLFGRTDAAWTVCPACMVLVEMHDGVLPKHKGKRRQLCLGIQTDVA